MSDNSAQTSEIETELIRVVQITYPGGAKCVNKADDIESLLDEIREQASDEFGGEVEYTIKVFHMSDLEYDMLPEFQGP